ncbi:WD40-repeat-containing domain protein [Pavlovales sp. CCMP2436]|nr:WD40-repeat-containing domain protein [Pavlovales sp. CCMP2436]
MAADPTLLAQLTGLEPLEAAFDDNEDLALGAVDIRSSWRQQALSTDASTETRPIATSNAKVQVLKRVNVEVSTDAVLAPMARDGGPAAAALERFLAARTAETVTALRANARSAAFEGWNPAAWSDGAEPVVCELSLRHIGGLALSAPDGVTAVSWNCTGAIVAAAYGVLDSAEGSNWAAHKSVLCAWSTTRRSLNPSKADAVIELADSVACLAFHPEEPTLLAGGSYNGDVLLWDVSNDEEPLLYKSTLSDYTHHEPVTALAWVRQLSKAQHQLVSLGADGRVLVWRPAEEAHRLSHPVAGFTVLASSAIVAARAFSGLGGGLGGGATDATQRVHGGMSLSFSREDPTSFVLGVEAGLLLKCALNGAEQRSPDSVSTAGNDVTWGAEAAALMARVPYADYQRSKLRIEKAVILAREYEVSLPLLFGAGVPATSLFPSPVAFTYEPHAGPVYGVAHSPFHRNLFLSVSTDSAVRLHLTLQEGGAGAQAGGGAQLQPSEALQASTKPIFSLQFNPRTAESLASGDGEGFVKLWKLGARLSVAKERESDWLEAFVTKLSAATDNDLEDEETTQPERRGDKAGDKASEGSRPSVAAPPPALAGSGAGGGERAAEEEWRQPPAAERAGYATSVTAASNPVPDWRSGAVAASEALPDLRGGGGVIGAAAANDALPDWRSGAVAGSEALPDWRGGGGGGGAAAANDALPDWRGGGGDTGADILASVGGGGEPEGDDYDE